MRDRRPRKRIRIGGVAEASGLRGDELRLRRDALHQPEPDILCLVLFGILGYGMRRFQFPAGPVIIGFILGPLLESSFDQTMPLPDGSFMIFLRKPGAVVLLLTVAAVASIIRARMRRSKIAELAREA